MDLRCKSFVVFRRFLISKITVNFGKKEWDKVSYISLLFAVFCVSSAQILSKSRLSLHGQMPGDGAIFGYILTLLKDPYMWLVGLFTVVGGVAWYFALSRLPISITIVYAALVYPIIIVYAYFVLKEPITTLTLFGMAMLIAGVLIVSIANQQSG